MMLSQLISDIVVRQLGDGDIQLIAHVAPECAQYLVVELSLLTGHHELVRSTESFIGYLSAHLHDVGILDGTTAEDDHQGNEGS